MVSLTVLYRHTFYFAAPGVTAAYAIDSTVIAAQVVPGGVEITGKSPGQTQLVMVTPNGIMRTVLVLVPQPTPNLPAGLRPHGDADEFGQYNFLYSNSPAQIITTTDFTQVQGTRQIHVQMANANLFSANGETPVGFPVLSYQIARPHQKITLVDSVVDNTDLTLNNVIVRGFHLQQGPWAFHAGITSTAQFQDFLLSSDRDEIAGISRQFPLTRRSFLQGNFYYFHTNVLLNKSAIPGGIGTLFYQYTRKDLQGSAEIGASRGGVAYAGKLDSGNDLHQLHAEFHYQSPGVVSLGVNQLHGREADVSWTGKLASRLSEQFFFTDTDLNLSTDEQDVTSANLNQLYRLTKHIGVNTGMSASRFVAHFPVAPEVESIGYIAGPEFTWKHFGTSFAYQQLYNNGNTPDSISYQVSAETSVSHVSLSAYLQTQTQAPVFAPVQTTQNDLKKLLQRESELAATPLQMAGLMRQTGVLDTLGYMQPLVVELAARRAQYGGEMNWSQEKLGRVTLNGMVSSTTGGNTPSLRLVTGGVTYTRSLKGFNIFSAGFSLFHSSSQGQSSMQPIMEVSLQHEVQAVPHWLIPGRHGNIEGHVFLDSDYTQHFSSELPPLSNVTVVLDGRRTAHTDKNGFFAFRGIPYGAHSVEVKYSDPRPFYYTSSSPQTVNTGDTADFGISFAQGRLFGTFVNDAGAGLGNITVTLAGQEIHREIVTDSDGQFEVDGLPNGTFQVMPEASSFPPGYSLSELQSQTVQVTAKKAGQIKFQIQAQRSISGHIDMYSTTIGRSLPLQDAEVTIDGVPRTVHTDSQGRYLFRQLPAGAYTVSVSRLGKTYTRKVVLAPEPDIEKDINITVPDTATPASLPNAPKDTQAEVRPRVESGTENERGNKPRSKPGNR